MKYKNIYIQFLNNKDIENILIFTKYVLYLRKMLRLINLKFIDFKEIIIICILIFFKQYH